MNKDKNLGITLTIPLNKPDTINLENGKTEYSIAQRFAVEVVKKIDDETINAITKWAYENGVTNMYLLDKIKLMQLSNDYAELESYRALGTVSELTEKLLKLNKEESK